MKYKIGDKVKVREDLIVDQSYPHVYFRDTMKPYKVVTIKGHTICGYSVEENVFVYSDNMLEGLYKEKGENKMKFKVGDIVIGNEKANKYNFTREGFIGEVTQVHGERMHIKRYCGIDSFYNVLQSCFDLYRENKKEEVNMKTKQKLIIAEPYTILIEGDKKTTVKANDEDYNQFKGVVMALLQHKLGMSYSKLKYLLYDMKKGDEELVLARYLLRQEGINTNKINKMIREADVQETKALKEREKLETEKTFNKWLKEIGIDQNEINKEYNKVNKEEEVAYYKNLIEQRESKKVITLRKLR